MATFSGITVNKMYKVKEIGVSWSEYDGIKISSGVTNALGDTNLAEGETEAYAETIPLKVGTDVNAVFHNKCNLTNMKNLYIHKQLQGEIDPGKKFTVLVKIAGHPYVGDYYIGDKEGSGDVYGTTNGEITFPADKVVTVIGNVTSEEGDIKGFPSGTTFKVTEIDLDNQYINPTYSIREGTAEDPETDDGYASGVFLLEGDNASITVTNTLKSKPEYPYIEIQKTFIGLEQKDLPNNFEIIIGNENELNLTNITSTVGQNNQIIYNWKLDDGAGLSTSVEEIGKDVEGYSVETTINGITAVNGSADIVQFNSFGFTISMSELQAINETQSLSTIPNIIIGKIEGNDSAKYLVWTGESLSIGEREAIIEEVKNGLTDITVDNSLFFSTPELIHSGINYIGSLILTEENSAVMLRVTDPEMWSAIYYGTYTRNSNSDVAEIEVVNTYTLQKVTIDLHKVGSEDTLNLDGKGAKFALYQGTVTEPTGAFEWEPTEYDSVEAKSDINELLLTPGYYKLVEIQAPQGFMLLTEPIFFKIDAEGVSLIQENGQPYAPGEEPDMWKIVPDVGNSIQLVIKNDVLYDLPEAGGSGIYLYMLGGVLLLMTGALMVYKSDKRRC